LALGGKCYRKPQIAVPPSLFIPWFELKPWVLPGGIKLQPFGLLVAIGILFGSRIAEWRGEKRGVPRYIVADFLVTTVVTGLIICMILNVALYEPEKFVQMGRAIVSWFTPGDSVSFPYPGLSSFGGFVGGTAAAIWYRQRKQVSLLVLGDIFCFAFPFAWIFGRSGCFSVHDHPGLATDFFLAVDNYNGQGVARHDLGLYEVIWSAVMIPTVLWLDRKPRPWGFFMAFVPIVYAPVRFALDFLREDPEHGGDVRYLGLTPGHYYSVAMLVVGIVVAIRVMRGPQPKSVMLDGSDPLPPPAEDKPASKQPDGKRTKRGRA
jgi:phosphatidylglycerol:prolipoprotein diacylglycerol transferase